MPAGTYTYTPASSLALSPSTEYYIVLTAGTVIANGAYEWSVAGANSYNPSGGWMVTGGVNLYFYHSTDGLSWSGNLGTYPLFAINATAVPEPSAKMLFGLGGISLLGFGRWKAKTG